MNPVGLRLNLTPDVLSKLVTAVASEKFRRFVRISRTQHAGTFYEVDLRILAEYDVQEPKVEGTHPTKSVVVTREMIGELFDVLGIFPRTIQSQTTLSEVRAQLRTIAQKLEAIYDIAGKSVDFRNPLNETVIEIREMARVALQLASVLQLVE